AAGPRSTLKRLDRRDRIAAASATGDTSFFRFFPASSGYSEATGAAVTGTRGEAITPTRATSRNCTRSDGTVVTLSANQPCAVGLAGTSVTNLMKNSEAFGGSGWIGGGGTIVADAYLAPDGTQTGDSFAQGTSDYTQRRQDIVADGSTYTLSAYLRADTGTLSAGGAAFGLTLFAGSTLC